MEELEHFGLVSKVCTELENHLGLSDKVLAEFLINLALESPSLVAFQKTIKETDPSFSDSLINNLHRLIHKLKPSKNF